MFGKKALFGFVLLFVCLFLISFAYSEITCEVSDVAGLPPIHLQDGVPHQLTASEKLFYSEIGNPAVLTNITASKVGEVYSFGINTNAGYTVPLCSSGVPVGKYAKINSTTPTSGAVVAYYYLDSDVQLVAPKYSVPNLPICKDDLDISTTGCYFEEYSNMINSQHVLNMVWDVDFTLKLNEKDLDIAFDLEVNFSNTNRDILIKTSYDGQDDELKYILLPTLFIPIKKMPFYSGSNIIAELNVVGDQTKRYISIIPKQITNTNINGPITNSDATANNSVTNSGDASSAVTMPVSNYQNCGENMPLLPCQITFTEDIWKNWNDKTISYAVPEDYCITGIASSTAKTGNTNRTCGGKISISVEKLSIMHFVDDLEFNTNYTTSYYSESDNFFVSLNLDASKDNVEATLLNRTLIKVDWTSNVENTKSGLIIVYPSNVWDKPLPSNDVSNSEQIITSGNCEDYTKVANTSNNLAYKCISDDLVEICNIRDNSIIGGTYVALNSQDNILFSNGDTLSVDLTNVVGCVGENTNTIKGCTKLQDDATGFTCSGEMSVLHEFTSGNGLYRCDQDYFYYTGNLDSVKSCIKNSDPSSDAVVSGNDGADDGTQDNAPVTSSGKCSGFGISVTGDPNWVFKCDGTDKVIPCAKKANGKYKEGDVRLSTPISAFSTNADAMKQFEQCKNPQNHTATAVSASTDFWSKFWKVFFSSIVGEKKIINPVILPVNPNSNSNPTCDAKTYFDVSTKWCLKCSFKDDKQEVYLVSGHNLDGSTADISNVSTTTWKTTFGNIEQICSDQLGPLKTSLRPNATPDVDRCNLIEFPLDGKDYGIPVVRFKCELPTAFYCIKEDGSTNNLSSSIYYSSEYDNLRTYCQTELNKKGKKIISLDGSTKVTMIKLNPVPDLRKFPEVNTGKNKLNDWNIYWSASVRPSELHIIGKFDETYYAPLNKESEVAIIKYVLTEDHAQKDGVYIGCERKPWTYNSKTGDYFEYDNLETLTPEGTTSELYTALKTRCYPDSITTVTTTDTTTTCPVREYPVDGLLLSSENKSASDYKFKCVDGIITACNLTYGTPIVYDTSIGEDRKNLSGWNTILNACEDAPLPVGFGLTNTLSSCYRNEYKVLSYDSDYSHKCSPSRPNVLELCSSIDGKLSFNTAIGYLNLKRTNVSFMFDNSLSDGSTEHKELVSLDDVAYKRLSESCGWTENLIPDEPSATSPLDATNVSNIISKCGSGAGYYPILFNDKFAIARYNDVLKNIEICSLNSEDTQISTIPLLTSISDQVKTLNNHSLTLADFEYTEKIADSRYNLILIDDIETDPANKSKYYNPKSLLQSENLNYVHVDGKNKESGSNFFVANLSSGGQFPNQIVDALILIGAQVTCPDDSTKPLTETNKLDPCELISAVDAGDGVGSVAATSGFCEGYIKIFDSFSYYKCVANQDNVLELCDADSKTNSKLKGTFGTRGGLTGVVFENFYVFETRYLNEVEKYKSLVRECGWTTDLLEGSVNPDATSSFTIDNCADDYKDYIFEQNGKFVCYKCEEYSQKEGDWMVGRQFFSDTADRGAQLSNIIIKEIPTTTSFKTFKVGNDPVDDSYKLRRACCTHSDLPNWGDAIECKSATSSDAIEFPQKVGDAYMHSVTPITIGDYSWTCNTFTGYGGEDNELEVAVKPLNSFTNTFPVYKLSGFSNSTKKKILDEVCIPNLKSLGYKQLFEGGTYFVLCPLKIDGVKTIKVFDTDKYTLNRVEYSDLNAPSKTAVDTLCSATNDVSLSNDNAEYLATNISDKDTSDFELNIRANSQTASIAGGATAPILNYLIQKQNQSITNTISVATSFLNSSKLKNNFSNNRSQYGFIVLHDGGSWNWCNTKWVNGKKQANSILASDICAVESTVNLWSPLQVSSHYYIGCSGQIYKLFNENVITFHAGCKAESLDCRVPGINSVSIGVDLRDCTKLNNGAPYTVGQEQALEKLLLDFKTRGLIKEISDKTVIGHFEVTTRKNDPLPGFIWTMLKNGITDHRNYSSGKTPFLVAMKPQTGINNGIA